MVQYVSIRLTPIYATQFVLPTFISCVSIIYHFDPIAYTRRFDPLNFNISITYAPLSSDVIFIHCTHAILSFILFPNQFTVDLSIATLIFILYYCLNIFFWWYLLYLFVVTTFLAFSCIFFVQVLFIISYHHSVIFFIINNHVFYDVFTFINLLVCMPHLYFWYNLIVSSYVFLVTFIFFKSNIYVVSILIIYPSSLFISILGFSSSISYYCSKSIFTLLGLYSIQKVEIPLWSQVDPAL